MWFRLLTVSLKSGWGFRHRTETEGVKVPFATITTIPNIQTALFIQPTAIGTVYEDLGGNHDYQLRLTQPTQKGRLQAHALSVHIRCNIAYTPWPSAYCPPLTSFYLSNITSFLSVLLSHFQPNTDTGHLVLFEDCGSILLAVGWLDYIVITSYVSQLVNHLCTRTPMGDLAGMEVIETSYYG